MSRPDVSAVFRPDPEGVGIWYPITIASIGAVGVLGSIGVCIWAVFIR